MGENFYLKKNEIENECLWPDVTTGRTFNVKYILIIDGMLRFFFFFFYLTGTYELQVRKHQRQDDYYYDLKHRRKVCIYIQHIHTFKKRKYHDALHV